MPVPPKSKGSIAKLSFKTLRKLLNWRRNIISSNQAYNEITPYVLEDKGGEVFSETVA